MSPMVRFARWLATFPPFQILSRRLVPAIDRVLHRISKGRVHLADAVIPTMILTTTGRRSGEPRDTPLAFVRDGDTYLVVGSNWGQAHHPAWSYNLIANPAATVSWRGRDVPVTASLLEGEARAEAWEALTAVWPTYDDYTAKARGRHLRVFRLVPRERTDRVTA